MQIIDPDFIQLPVRVRTYFCYETELTKLEET